MNKTKKPAYTIWKNTVFMLQTAWRVSKGVIFLCLALALTVAGRAVAELLIAPMLLQTLEAATPLGKLLRVIALFAAALVLLAGLQGYLETNKLCGRITVRCDVIRQITTKSTQTSYPNLYDTAFWQMKDKALRACNSNDAPTEAIWQDWTELLTNLIGFAVYLALLSDLHPLLMLLVVASTVAGFFLTRHIDQWGYRHREEQAKYQKAMAYSRRTAIGREYAKDIRIFGLCGWIEDVRRSAESLYFAFIARRERVYLWSNVAELILNLLRNGAAYAYLLWLTLTEGLPASQFLLYFTAVSGFTQWVTGICGNCSNLHRQSLEISTIREYLDWPEPFRFSGGKPLAKQDAYELRLEHVSFRYPEAEADTLHDIDLTIRPGEKLAIVGLNGAGKTTLVKLLCGLLDPSEGRVLLNGEDIRQYNRRDYYALFSAVFQEFSVLETTVSVNVAQRVDGIDLDRVRECIALAGLKDAIAALPNGLETNIGRQVYEDGVELSGGQMQRLMLARALYKGGPILALDEPTAALDPIAENDIYRKYNDMTAGKTAVFISHRLATTRFCDRILFLSGGHIAEQGTHEQLLAQNGGYAALFQVQSRYYQEGGEHHAEAE